MKIEVFGLVLSKGLVDDNTVKIDELTDNRYVRLDIPKAMVNHG